MSEHRNPFLFPLLQVWARHAGAQENIHMGVSLELLYVVSVAPLPFARLAKLEILSSLSQKSGR